MVVDYAHTPDALERALLSCQKHCAGDLWAVFGCGGDRDRSKRSAMGTLAEQYADKVILTNDNPRSEEPMSIISQIVTGMRKRPTIIEDRSVAVAYAIERATNKDLVLVAGKGHEDYQVIGDQMHHYSDRQWVEKCMGTVA